MESSTYTISVIFVRACVMSHPRRESLRNMVAIATIISMVSKVLGFSAAEIEELLPDLYDMLHEKMMKIRRLRKD